MASTNYGNPLGSGCLKPSIYEWDRDKWIQSGMICVHFFREKRMITL